MTVLFKKKVLEAIYKNGKETGKPIYGTEVIRSFIKKIAILWSVSNSAELAMFRSLRLEALKKEEKYKGMHSIRVNDQYRIILKIVKDKNGTEIVEVIEIHDLTDYH